jgi:hypothetical protein
MIERSIFLDREDTRLIEEEEQSLFIRGILEEFGVPLEDIWPDTLLTIEQKIKLRGLLGKLDIEIINDGDRECQIYYQNNKLAEWFKPRFILREDKGARTLNKKLYYEMVIKTWSIYDQQEEE